MYKDEHALYILYIGTLSSPLASSTTSFDWPESDASSTTAEEDIIPTTNSPDETKKPTINYNPVNTGDPEFVTALETIVTTDEADLDEYFTTADSTNAEEWMEETTALTTSSDSELDIATQSVTGLMSNYSNSKHYEENEMTTHATTSLSTS